MMIQEEYYDLLKTWCDRLLDHQIQGTGNVRFDGAFLCPACMKIHGRSHDGVYPLLYMADVTGEDRYLKAAVSLFDWGENMVCDDGSFYNDPQREWNGITVFSVIGLYESLVYHGHLLSKEKKAEFEKRMRDGAEWVYQTITMDFVTNINYHATAAAALALVGTYDENPGYLEHAKELAYSCAAHILPEGYLYGEGKPMEAITERDCRPVDIGYNAEESIPSLLTYARTTGDDIILGKVKELLWKQLDFMLPDGAWDNSFGTRNFKWTYWGSRTSDGCHTAYGTWGKEEPVFAEAARRNLELLKACTHDGLLYGGPDYQVHGESPCIHHTFCHAKALAGVLDHGTEESEETKRVELPCEQGEGVNYYPTTDTYKIRYGGFIATVTAYDFEYLKGGHASGGTMSLLWHKKAGAVCLSSMTDYKMHEPHNMQLSVKKACHQSLTPRIELNEDGEVFASCYDYHAQVRVYEKEESRNVIVNGELVNIEQKSAKQPVFYQIEYIFKANQLTIQGNIRGECRDQVRMILPVLGRTEEGICNTDSGYLIPRKESNIRLICSQTKNEPEAIFYLAGGFEAWKFEIVPESDGTFFATIWID